MADTKIRRAAPLVKWEAGDYLVEATATDYGEKSPRSVTMAATFRIDGRR
ncbi:MAG: hypothetical protein K1Y01_10420 [Vicinamibacteria bacterium]|nr:hypothetical protein [Vicinamibacteria bacterium]